MNQRIFICGSEWLYLKIYSGPKTVENIMVNEIYPLLKNFLNNNIIDMFFFIRYYDPSYHIRLRLHFSNTKNIGIVLDNFNKILYEYITNYLISNVVIDTYNREIERYRDKFILEIESLFFYDSKFILDYIVNNPESENEKWLIPIKYIDSLLDKCGFALENKLELCNHIYEDMSIKMGTKNKTTNEQLKLKYRNHSKAIKEVINDYTGEKHAWINGLNNYLNNINQFTEKLKSESPSEIEDLVISIIHMHINRLFRTRQRIDECVIYYLLYKFYNSIQSFSKMRVK